jgi:O-antigen ligase
MDSSLLKKSREYLFILAIFFLPIYQTINHWFFGAFLLVSFLIIILERKQGLKSRQTNIYLLAIALFFLIQVIGLLYASDFNYGLKKVTRALPFLLYPLAILSFKGSIKFIVFEKKIFYALSLGCFTTAIICWTNIILFSEDCDLAANTFFGWKKSGIYLTQVLDLHPPYLGLLIVAAIIYLVKELLFYSNMKFQNRILNLGLITVLFVFLFNITARNSLFFLLSLGIVYAIYQRKWKFLIVQLILGILLISVVIYHPSQYYRLKLYHMIGLSDKPIEDKRFSRLNASFLVFKSSPIFGVGPGNDIHLKVEQYALMNDEIALKNRLNSHNQLFEYLAAYGLIGAAIFIGVNSVFAVFFYRKRQFFYLVLLIGILIASLTESVFERVLGIQYYCIIVSLGILSHTFSNTKIELKK